MNSFVYSDKYNFGSGMMIVIETDHNAYTEDTKSQRKIQMAEEMREAAGEDEQVILVVVVANHQVIKSLLLHLVSGSLQPPAACPRNCLGLGGWVWRGN